jgi:16S rRNA (adenine1518-N6/adenine1519-N6)-dimethyltransferase
MRWTRQALAALLRERGHRPRKSLGQNFLADENFLEAIVRDAGIGPADGVIEIGSGPGNLTERLAARASRAWAFEVDATLFEIARERLAGLENVRLFRLDGARFEEAVDPGACRSIKAVSNLPYRDWERLLLALLSTRLPIDSMTLMLQADVYGRLRAPPGTREYGPMGVLVQATCEVRLLRRAGRRLFFPEPRVDSVLFELRRHGPCAEAGPLQAALRRLFSRRRGTSPLAGGRRVERMAPRELLDLARTFV